MSRKLTAKQQSFYDFLVQHVREEKRWPTYREIVDHFDYRSPNSVTQNLQALRKKGYLTYDQGDYDFTDKRLIQEEPGIPVRGTIAAGVLQEAIEEDLGTITLETLFPNIDRLFAIRVAGQSMIGEGIDDGDYVLLVDESIPNGGIGAVLYDGETSLKRIYRDKDGLRLEPANEAYDDIYLHPDVDFEEVRILGRYAGHINENGIYKRAGLPSPARAEA